MKKKNNELYFELPDKEHNLVIDVKDDGQVYYEEPDDETIEIVPDPYTEQAFLRINDDNNNFGFEVRYEDQDDDVKKMLDSLDEIYKDLK